MVKQSQDSSLSRVIKFKCWPRDVTSSKSTAKSYSRLTRQWSRSISRLLAAWASWWSMPILLRGVAWMAKCPYKCKVDKWCRKLPSSPSSRFQIWIIWRRLMVDIWRSVIDQGVSEEVPRGPWCLIRDCSNRATRYATIRSRGNEPSKTHLRSLTL